MLALLAIPMVRYAVAALVSAVTCCAVFGVALWRHDARVRERATAAIERKAEEHVRVADDVRDAVAAGTRGMRDPYRRDRDAQE